VPEAEPSKPLRSPAFRWFFAGWSISMAGSAMAPVALAFGVLEVIWVQARSGPQMLPSLRRLEMNTR
jgi:hypothetical protein